jgi:hypothetical protein
MYVDPQRLIDRSIADLTQLSALFAAEVRGEPLRRSPAMKACEEAAATIESLIPRLKLAREMPIAPLRLGACTTCDE